VGGNGEVVEHGLTGHLIPPSDPDALAAAVRVVLDDDASRRAMVDRAHSRIGERYSLDVMVHTYEALYQSLLAEKRGVALTPRPQLSAGAVSHVHSPEVSFVIPCFNGRDYLVRCLQSLAGLEQAGQPTFEAIVVDDGSAEDILEVTGRFPSFVRYIRQENQGPAAARNVGVEHANGTYIWFLDSDDYILSPEVVGKQIALLEKHPEVALVHAQALKVDSYGTPIGVRRPRFTRGSYLRSGDREIGNLLYYNYITTSTVVVRRSALQQSHPFDPRLRGPEDWDCWLRVASRGHVAYVDEPVVAYRVHEASITAGYAPEAWLRIHHEILDRLFADHAFRTRFAGHEQGAYARLVVRAAGIAYQRGQMKVARGYLSGAIRDAVRHARWGDIAQVLPLAARTLVPIRVMQRLRRLVHSQRVLATSLRLTLRQSAGRARLSKEWPVLT
jgi:glycosyltransferase involved in cell wall biosynthesis